MVQNRGPAVLGPLPRLHRLLLIATVLVVGIASGAWIALFTPLPVAATAGAAVGAVAGLLLGYLLVHDFSQSARTVRVHRRH
jgi:xanthine/uracil permease